MNIAELTDLPVSDMIPFFDSLKLTEKQQLIGKQIFKEIKARLNFLQTVGLDYLTLSRTAGTLSGGEASESAWRPRSVRAWSASSTSWTNRLSACISGITTSSWKPSSAARPGQYTHRLEHDEDTMRAADYIVDIGPAAGEHGGTIVAQGSAEDIMLALSH